MKKYFSKNKSIKITMIILALFLLITIPYALSKSGKNKENQNKTISVTQKDETKKETNKSEKTKNEKNNIKETKKETNNETKKDSKDKTTKKETTKEKTNTTKKETTTTSKQNTKVEKPKENKVTKSTPSKPKETKKEVVRTTETQSISFNTIDNYSYTGGKSRVYQEGRSGVRTIVKEDGRVVSNTITTQPQDKIIERYVKLQSAEYKTVEKEVDDLDRPIYDSKWVSRWFVKNDFTGETKYFYSEEEAHAEYSKNGENGQLSSWGTAEQEEIVSDEIIGYYTKIVKETVKVQDEVWEWKH